jgi:gliding motility-associated lipoprotein GldH
MKKNKRIVLYLILSVCSFATVLMASCNEKTVYYSYCHTSLSGWDKTDTLSFAVPPVDIAGKYAENVALRFTSSYPFQTLNLIVEQRVKPGKTVMRDTINCVLIDKSGHVNGKGLNYLQCDVPLDYIDLQKGQSVSISIRHNMRREILPGISDIGVRLYKE